MRWAPAWGRGVVMALACAAGPRSLGCLRARTTGLRGLLTGASFSASAAWFLVCSPAIGMAAALNSIEDDELRIDPQDGGTYTKEEFQAFYGGDWERMWHISAKPKK